MKFIDPKLVVSGALGTVLGAFLMNYINKSRSA